MTIYVVQVTPEASVGKVSQAGYRSLDAAKDFIENRSNNPKQIGPYHYRDEDYTEYTIYEVTV